MKRASPNSEVSSINTDLTGRRVFPAPGAASAPVLRSVPLTTAGAAPPDFYAAARNGDAPALLFMLASGSFRATATDPVTGMTALMLAAMHGHADVAALLTRGTLAAYIDLQDTQSNTALSMAQAAGHAEVVQLLRSRGAGWTGADAGEAAAAPPPAPRGARNACSQLLSALFDAIESNDLEALRAVLARAGRLRSGPAIILRMTGQRTLPGAAAREYTPLMAAAWLGHADIVTALTAAGASLNQANSEQVTALMLAAKKGNCATVELLIEAGASVSKARQDGWTALLLAAYYGHADTVKALIRARANLHVSTPDGVTALMYAAMNGHAEAVQALIGAGANSRLMSRTGHTALSLAIRGQHERNIQLLDGDGAQLTIERRV